MTRSARSAGTASAPRPELGLEGERVGLIDAAAEGDDGVLHALLATLPSLSGEGLPADVATVLHAVEANARDARRTRVDRRLERRALPTTVITRPPDVTSVAVVALHAGVKDQHVRALGGDASSPSMRCPVRRRRDSLRRPARRRRAARGSRTMRVSAASPVAAAHRSGASGSAIIGSTTCASGSPKRTLNSITFGPSAVSIRPQYRKPRYGVPSDDQPVEHRPDDLAQDASRASASSTSGARRERAHAAGVGPAVVVEDPLVILRGHERHGMLAVGDDEERDFGPVEPLLEHDACARIAERAIDHHGADRRLGFGRASRRRRRPCPRPGRRP